MPTNRIALITGSGFSKEANLPLTSEISRDFINNHARAPNSDIQGTITRRLKEFWQVVFAYCGDNLPSFEDHFTLLDLAANAGHNLRRDYPPSKLRAIRRFSIHRVFDILDRKYEDSCAIKDLLKMLGTRSHKLTVVTLNWDIVIENHLRALNTPFSYAGNVANYREAMEAASHPRSEVRAREDESGRGGNSILVHKMHGSANWGYCDICRKWFYGDVEEGKFCLHRKILLERRDFQEFRECVDESDLSNKAECPDCGKPRGPDEDKKYLGARVGTFSFRKDLAQFQAVWESALEALREADTWLFIGYSLPEADYEFKHLLKTAQLAHKRPNDLTIEVVLKRDCQAQERYECFFGDSVGRFWQSGLCSWVDRRLPDFMSECV